MVQNKLSYQPYYDGAKSWLTENQKVAGVINLRIINNLS